MSVPLTHNRPKRPRRRHSESLFNHTLSQILQLRNEPNFKNKTVYRYPEHPHRILRAFTITLAPYPLPKYMAMALALLLQLHPCIMGTGQGRLLLPRQDTMDMDLVHLLQLPPSSTLITLDHHHQTHNLTLALHHLLPHHRTEQHIPHMGAPIHISSVLTAITPHEQSPHILLHQEVQD